MSEASVGKQETPTQIFWQGWYGRLSLLAFTLIAEAVSFVISQEEEKNQGRTIVFMSDPVIK